MAKLMLIIELLDMVDACGVVVIVFYDVAYKESRRIPYTRQGFSTRIPVESIFVLKCEVMRKFISRRLEYVYGSTKIISWEDAIFLLISVMVSGL